jgi:hypothetical protein
MAIEVLLPSVMKIGGANDACNLQTVSRAQNGERRTVCYIEQLKAAAATASSCYLVRIRGLVEAILHA